MKRVFLRADASKTIGYGHFIRSLALAAYLKPEFECHFFTFNALELHPSSYQLDEIAKVAKYVPIKAKNIEEYDTAFLALLTGNEIVVLDNYYYSTSYQQKIKDKGCKLVYIDGMPNQHYIADVIISPGEMTRSDFSLENYTVFLNGINHSFLRHPFLESDNHIRHVSSIKRIVLAVGGADPFGLTDRLIKLIFDVNPDIQIDAIVGDTVEVSADIASKVKRHVRLSAAEIVRVFSSADIGVFSASTICIEALACHLPIAAGWYVDNQKEFYKYGVREGLFMPLGYLLDNEQTLKNNIRKVLATKEFNKSKFIDFKTGEEDIINQFKHL